MVTGQEPRLTYIKFLEMLLAVLPEEEYKADVGSWSRAVCHLKGLYDAKYPELFDRFEFLERDPAPPHSDQVNYFLRIEQEGDVIHVYNPGYELLKIDKNSKNRLRKRHKELLAQYEAAIREFIPEASRYIAVEAASEPKDEPSRGPKG